MFASSAQEIRFSAARFGSKFRRAPRSVGVRRAAKRGLHVEALEQRALLAVVPLITETSPSRGIVATQAIYDDVGNVWTGGNPTFDDSTWTASIPGGPNGIGAPIGAGKYGQFASINAASMVGTSNTAFLRIPFTVADASLVEGLTLKMRFDDGFIAYVNGQEVLRQNVAGTNYPAWATPASQFVPMDASAFVEFDISSHAGALRDGGNILAIRGFDRPQAGPLPLSQDFVIQAALDAELVDIPPTANDDVAATQRNAPVAINVLANDAAGDAPIDPTTVQVVDEPNHGSATVNATTGAITYTPISDFRGTDTFTYRVRDTSAEPTPGEGTTSVTVVTTTASHRRLVPTAAISASWTGSAAFDDSLWTVGTGGIGYERDVANVYDPYFLGDTEAAMYNAAGAGGNTTAYVRYPFTVSNPAGVVGLRLRMRYDDGFVAYINGMQVASANAPVAPAWNSAATATNPDTNAVVQQEFVIPLSGLNLRSGAGANILAIHGLNDFVTSTDFLIQPELIADTTLRGLWSNHATVTVNVAGPGPFAVDDAAATTGREPVVVDVLANDTPGTPPNDFPLRPESVTIVSPPANGTATVDPATGTITYQANPGFSGEDTLQYTVRDAASVGGETGPATLLPRFSTWRYLDNGTDQGTAWRATNFDDSTWPSGPAELGYTDAPVTTIRCTSAPMPCDIGASNKHITYYFRSTFNLDNPAAVLALNVLASYDDGAVVYINGTEVARSPNMPAGEITYQTLANPDHEGGNFETLATLSSTLLSVLRPGTNVVAVEIHQNSATSSDLTFDLELTGTMASQTGHVSNVATVTVSVASTEAPPVAADDAVLTKVAQQATIEVLANDEPGGAPLDVSSVTIVAAPANGTATVLGDGRVTYLPDEGFTGTDTFTYTVRDTDGRVSNVATVSIAVVTSVVSATSDLYFAEEDDALFISAAFGVLRNDSSDGGDVVSATLVEAPGNGSVELATDGSFQYVPNANFAGDDTFRYRATDSLGESADGVVTIRVTGTPDAPVALGDLFSTPANTPLVVVAAPADRHVLIPAESEWRYRDDVDSLSSSWRSVNYDDSAWFVGRGQFGYGDGDETTVIRFGDDVNSRRITTYFRREFFIGDVANVHRAWIGLLRDDGAAIHVNNVFPIVSNLLANAPASALAIEPVTGADENTYFPLDVTSNRLVSGRNVIAVEIHQASTTSNDMSFDLYLHGDVAGPVTAGVLANDIDPDGDYLTARLVTPPAHGTLSLSADGGFVYTPNAGFAGSDSFTYQATDGERLSDIATVVINVAPSAFAAADLNEDGVVDAADLAMVVGGFGQAADADKYAGDANGDGCVDLNDAMMVRQAIAQQEGQIAAAPAAVVAGQRGMRVGADTADQHAAGLAARAVRRAAGAATFGGDRLSLDASNVDRAIDRAATTNAETLRAVRRRT